MLEHDTMVHNILEVYRAATPRQIAEGMAWYGDAHSLALALDPTNPRRAAGVIAALSPRLPWSQNVKLAARAYADGFASGALGNSCRAATTILEGADPLEVLRGPKVRAFFANVLDPTDSETVTVDMHAVDISQGYVDPIHQAWLKRRGAYTAVADAYRTAASIAGLSAPQLQAITWVAWREMRRTGQLEFELEGV